MAETSHAIQILIKGKNATGDLLKKVGMDVVALTKLSGGLGKALSSLGQIGKESLGKGVAGAVTIAKTAVSAFTSVIAAAGKVLVGAAVGAGAFAVGIGTVTAALTAGVAAATMYAAELELITNAMWGITGEAMPALIDGLREASAGLLTQRDLAMRYNEAFLLVGDTLTERMPEALRSLTKVAAATGEEVGGLMQRLSRSIGRLSTRWMAHLGAVVTIEEATATAAQMFGVAADALTREQIQAGMLDRVLEKLAATTGAMPEIIDTVQQLSVSLRVSWKDLFGDIGRIFLPAAQAFLKTLHAITNVIKGLIKEGGALYLPLRKIAAAFTAIFEILGDLMGRFTEVEDTAMSGLEALANKIIDTAWKALKWGAEISVNLATGLIKGASYALTAAMNFISNLLAGWLVSRSPPKIVSNIVNWGAAAFTYFLEGFSLADFDVLEGVQAPLKKALGVLVDLGKISEITKFESFIDISESLAEALSGAGSIGEVISKLGEVGGGYGESIAELYRRQLDLASAVKILAAAEERLVRARKAEEVAGVKLTKQAREYNKLVRAGASPAILKAKLAEVEASYNSLVAAREESEVAEDARDQAKDTVKEREEQVKLQNRLLAQLIEMGQAYADMWKAKKKAEEEDEGFVLPPIEFPEGHLLPIDQAFIDLKERIKEQFLALWADLKTQWEESGVGKAIEDLSARWETFQTDILDPLKEKLKEVWDTFKGWVDDEAWPWILEQWETWTTWWDENGPAIIGWFTDLGTEIGLMATGQSDHWNSIEANAGTLIEYLEEDFKGSTFWQWILTEWGKWKTWWETDGPVINSAIEDLIAWLGDLGFAATVSGDDMLGAEKVWEKAWDGIVRFVERDVERLKKFLRAAGRNIVINIEGTMDTIRTLISVVAKAIKGDFRGAWNDIVTYAQRSFARVQDILGQWPEKIRAGTTAFLHAGNMLMDALIGAIRNKAWEVITAISSVVLNAIETAKNLLGERSESKVFFGIGQNLAQGLTSGIESLASKPVLAVANMTGSVIAAPVMTAAAAGVGSGGQGGATYYIENNFGRDSVRSDADIMAIVEAQQRSLTLRGIRDQLG